MTVEDCATKACTRCGIVKPSTTEFFSPRADGRLKLASGCKVCHAERKREKYKDPEFAKRFDESHAASRKKRLANDPEYRARYRARANERRQRQRSDPEYWERELEKDRIWRKANWNRVKNYKHKSGALQVFHVMQRHAAKLKATPFWADLDAIKAMYEEARRVTLETGIPHNVDHVIPLRGRLVCGLNIALNMQILTAEANKRKSNKFMPELLEAA